MNCDPDDRLPFVETAPADNFEKNPGDFVILVKGNSISRHGCNEKTIRELGWDRECGMAASCEETDYAHLFAARIQTLLPTRRVRLLFGKGGRPELAVQTVEEEKRCRPELIVVQNGEHSASRTGIVDFERDYDRLLEALQSFPGSPAIIAIGVWNPRCREEFDACTGENYDHYAREIARIQSQVTTRRGIAFADVSGYENDPANTGSGLVAGVRWHPNDRGMRCYAEAAFAAYQRSQNHV